MAKSHIDKLFSSLAGEFGVASELCLRQYVASLTLKNYPGVDLFVLNPRNDKQTTIQVKASTDGWFNAPKVLPPKGCLVYVSIKEGQRMTYYVIPNKVVLRIREKNLRECLRKHPAVKKDQPIWLGGEDHFARYRGRWNLLGLG